MRFQGRIALISAAGRGIGRESAEIIGREGGTVVAVDNDKDALESVVGAIRAGGGTAHGMPADGLEAAQVEDVVRRTVDARGRIDILVNAVGGSTIIGKPAANVEDLTLAEWQQLLHFNLTGTFLFTHAVVPVMKRQRSGKIVNISSIAGRGKSPTSSSAYATAKGGIIALTRKLSLELGPYNVNINAIAPSLTLSPRLRPRWDKMSAEEKQQEVERVPLRRIAEPVDQARVICFLASSDDDLFTANATAAMKDRMPYVVEGPDGPQWTCKAGTSFGLVGGVGPSGQKLVPGQNYRVDKMAAVGLYEDGKKGIRRPTDPHLRLKDQELDGVDAEVIFGILGAATRLNDHDAAKEMFRIYNDWLVDFCRPYPDRHIGLACLPYGDIDAAVKEIHRVAKMGLKGL